MIGPFHVTQVPADPLVLTVSNDDGTGKDVSGYTTRILRMLDGSGVAVDTSAGTVVPDTNPANIGRVSYLWPSTSLFTTPGVYRYWLELNGPGTIHDLTGVGTFSVLAVGQVELMPGVDVFAKFWGPEAPIEDSDWEAHAQGVLQQASDLLTLVSGVSAVSDPRQLRLVQYAIMDMAVLLFVMDPSESNSPYSSERIGSYCVDEITEILTSSGWKGFRDVRPGDEVLTLNPVSRLSEWQPAVSVNIFSPQTRDMLLIESRQFSSMTTLEHRWLVDRQGVMAWTKSADMLAGGVYDKVPMAAFYGNAPSDPKYSDALVEMVAWFWTEGGWSWKGRHRGVRIHQSRHVNESNCARIRAALTRLFGAPAATLRRSPAGTCCVTDCEKQTKARKYCGPHYMEFWRSGADRTDHLAWVERPIACRSAGSYSSSTDPEMAVFDLSAAASAVITDHVRFDDKSVRTEFIRNLTPSQLELFIEVSWLADGSGSKQLAQKDRSMVEQLMLACILAGRRVSLHQQKSGMWQLTATRKQEIRPYTIKKGSQYGKTASTFGVVQYGGCVWCPSTPNGTWMARRNGTVYFTGNSYSLKTKAASGTTGLFWWDQIIDSVNGDGWNYDLLVPGERVFHSPYQTWFPSERLMHASRLTIMPGTFDPITTDPSTGQMLLPFGSTSDDRWAGDPYSWPFV